MENSFEQEQQVEDEQEKSSQEEADHQENAEEEAEEEQDDADEEQEEQQEDDDELGQQQEPESAEENQDEENEAEEEVASLHSQNEDAQASDEEVASSRIKKRQILSDESDQGMKEESENEDELVAKKKKKHKKHKSHKKSHKKHKGSDEDQEDAASSQEEEDEPNEQELQEEVNDLNEEEITSGQQAESEDDTGPNEQEVRPKMSGDSNLDRVLSTQKALNKRKNRRKVDSEELNDMDTFISELISGMKNVAAEDRAANEKGLTSIGKIKMLPSVIGMLQKSDYHSAMIDLGILHAIAEWMAPLPDRSLPNIRIRETLIDALKDFGEIGSDYLKSSGVGKAVMFLYKHSKETKQNKQKLEKLIHNWSRPIFNLDANFKQLSKEERLQRDIEQVRSMRRNSADGPGQSVDEILSVRDKKKRKNRPGLESDRSEAEDPNRVLRPGDPGFIPRARVPVPTHKDYIIRPKSNVDVSESSSKKIKKAETRLEKHQKKFVEFKRTNKFHRAVTMSVNDKG
ncbi:IWS1 -like protein [Brachionus plicatilis]|uniref:IWS1-like protein n=1 Tax=Brachionus plicatilis TaxID=10195 RepID=A0A3M7PVI4_BRAPC|nr:IWS1 -like protein [Brachionus plicatilis]